jgi:hypothetical protein
MIDLADLVSTEVPNLPYTYMSCALPETNSAYINIASPQTVHLMICRYCVCDSCFSAT